MSPLAKIFWTDMGEMLHIQAMVLKALFRMHSVASGAELKEALAAYEKLVKDQTNALKKIYAAAETLPKEKKCDGMMGVLLKGQQFILRSDPGPCLDAALLSVCSKVASYKSASLFTLASWAKFVLQDQKRAVQILEQAARQEKEALDRFTALAQTCDEQAAGEMEKAPRPAPRRPTQETADFKFRSSW